MLTAVLQIWQTRSFPFWNSLHRFFGQLIEHIHVSSRWFRCFALMEKMSFLALDLNRVNFCRWKIHINVPHFVKVTNLCSKFPYPECLFTLNKIDRPVTKSNSVVNSFFCIFLIFNNEFATCQKHKYYDGAHKQYEYSSVCSQHHKVEGVTK